MKKIFTLCLLAFLGVIQLNAQQAWSTTGGDIDPHLFVNSSISSTCTDGSGNVYAAGAFTNSSSKRYVAKWSTTGWIELGGLNGLSANNGIFSIATDASGNVYAGGVFTNSSGNFYVAKWDGTSWSELGGLNGLAANSHIRSVCTDASGNVYAAGQFTNSSGKRYVAKWNGSAWSELGGLNGLSANNLIQSICTDASGNVYAAGYFSNAFTKNYVAKFNGTAWSELGGLNVLAANSFILSVCADAFGNVYAAGSFSNGGNFSSIGNKYVAKWNGTSWSELGGLNGLSANNYIMCIRTDASGNVYAAGSFTNASSKNYVAKFNGTSWGELGGLNGLSANSDIMTICTDASGNVFAAGSFTLTSTISKNYVAKFNGTNWGELVATNASLFANSFINCIYTDPSGNLYAAGYFSTISNKQYVAKWNGSTWIELGGLNGLSANDQIFSITSDAAGNVYATGNFTNSSGNRYVAKWDGTSWSELGGLNSLAAGNGTIYSVCTDAAGNVYAAGGLANSSGKYYVAKWDGTSWSELGGLNGLSANNAIKSICTDASGNVYATGFFTNSVSRYYVAKFNGSIWSVLGGGNGLNVTFNINSICTDASGNVYAAGGFTNSSGKYYVAKYNGTVWSELGGLNGLSANQKINSISTDAVGNVYAAGNFTNGINSTSGNRYVAKFDGTVWSELAGLNGLSANNEIAAVCTDASGNIYTAGVFKNSGNRCYVAKCSCIGLLTPSVSIAVSGNNICENSSVTFTATPVNGGTTPRYLWKKNRANITGSSTTGIQIFAPRTLANNDTITCVMTSNDACLTNATANSNSIIMIVRRTTSSINNLSICPSALPYSWNGLTFTSTGSQTKTGLVNSIGCDSSATLNLTVKANSSSTTNLSICPSELPYSWNGLTFAGAGSQTKNGLVNSVGCDSSATLNLVIKANTTSTTNLSICPSALPYTWNGLTFNATGSQTAHLTNSVGCDSAATLNLTVKATSTSTTNTSICPSDLPYTWNGLTFNATGSQTAHLTNSVGCDSAATLNLTVKVTSSSTNHLSICPSALPYSWNGLTFNVVGSQTAYLTNSVGCDSAATLNLVLQQPTSSTSNVNLCSNQLPYNWNGINYTAAGTYNKTLTNASGCDSIATLVLTVGTAITPTISITTASASVCNNVTTTFTASTVTGGLSPVFEWKKNGVNIGTGLTYSFMSGALATNDIISCTLTANNACQTTAIANSNAIKMTVNAAPAIGTSTGATICTIGSSIMLYNTNASGGGVWTTDNASIATVNTIGGANGSVVAIGNGTATMTFTKTNIYGCKSSVTSVVTVAQVASIAAIGGATSVCKGATTTLTNTTPNGVWKSQSTSTATIDSVTGVVTGVYQGTATIRYTVKNAYGCSNFASISLPVNTIPAVPTVTYAAGTVNPQVGPGGSFCVNDTFKIVGTPTGGVFSSSNTATATVGASTGKIKILAVGTTNIKYVYTAPTGCSNSQNFIGVLAAICPGHRGGAISNNQFVSSNDFTIYPNPARTSISLNVKTLIGAGTIVVTDLYGKQVKTQALSIGNNIVDISNFAKGFYLVSVITTDGKTTKKLVVE